MMIAVVFQNFSPNSPGRCESFAMVEPDGRMRASSVHRGARVRYARADALRGNGRACHFTSFRLAAVKQFSNRAGPPLNWVQCYCHLGAAPLRERKESNLSENSKRRLGW